MFACSGRLCPVEGIILSTVPDMVVLDSSGIRAASSFSPAILADLDMRGFAISFLTLSRVASPCCFLAFFLSMLPSWDRHKGHAVPFRTVAKDLHAPIKKASRQRRDAFSFYPSPVKRCGADLLGAACCRYPPALRRRNIHAANFGAYADAPEAGLFRGLVERRHQILKVEDEVELLEERGVGDGRFHALEERFAAGFLGDLGEIALA